MSELKPFSDRLLAWWDVHGRKDLPWQHPRTPYRVWVSEIMLQQTQVTTVIDYFEAFMERFPVLSSLAEAPLDDVLAAWSGLGYYARARNLHKAAQTCMTEHRGQLPDTADELSRLPGIGRSTANAIVSQTQDIPATVMDGNVKRVMARHAAIEGWPGKSAVLKELLKAADQRLPAERGADYTQAIMDLGATLCRGKQPDCPDCPVREDCEALKANNVANYPGKKPNADVKTRTVYMLIIQKRDGSVLLRRRPSEGIWGGLWCLPDADDAVKLKARYGIAHATELPGFDHRLTHRLLKIRPLMAKRLPDPRDINETGDLVWYGPDQWPELGLPKAVEKVLAAL